MKLELKTSEILYDFINIPNSRDAFKEKEALSI